jgi:hypothetical protein
MTQTVAMKLLNAAVTAGDGPVFNLDFPQLAAAVQAEIAGAPTQAVINVMALLDGGTWDTLCVLDTSQGYVSGEISPLTFPAPIRQIKGNQSLGLPLLLRKEMRGRRTVDASRQPRQVLPIRPPTSTFEFPLRDLIREPAYGDYRTNLF